MNITKEESGDLTAIIKIELAKDDYEQKVKTVLKDYQRKANIPGFRPGKVPFGMVNKMYGKAVLAEEVNKLISDSLNKYIVDEKLDILGYPLPNTEKTTELDFDTQEKFDFYFDIGLSPEFEINLDDKFKVKYYNIKADEDVVKKYLADLRNRNGKTSKPEVSEESDILIGDFEELNPKQEALKGSAQLKLESIKSKTALKNFVGVKIGDQIKFDPAKTLKSEIEVAALLGLTADKADAFKSEIQFTITEINRIEPAELNEEFFKMVYPQDKIENEEQLKARIKKDAEVSFQAESDRLFMNNAVEMLIDKANISVPDDFLKRWLLESNEGKVTPEQLEVQYDSYIKSLKWQLIESKLVKGNDIEVKEEDVRNHIKGYFMNMTLPESEDNDDRLNDIVNSVMQNKEEVKKIYDQLYDKKLLDFFKENIKQTKKEVSYEEFVKLATQIK